MGLNVVAASSGEGFEKCPEGTFIGRCYGVVDLGTQTTAFLDDKTGLPKKAKKVKLLFEILETGVRTADFKVFQVSEEFTASLDKKANLRARLKGWRGKDLADGEGFSLANVVGQYAQLTIGHTQKDDKTYANITGVSALHASIPKPAPVTANLIFDLDDPKYLDVYTALPEWLQRRVEGSEEWKDPARVQRGLAQGVAKKAPAPAPAFVDDIPGQPESPLF